jgi:hypothetical protein
VDKEKGVCGASIRDLLTEREPITSFFFEHQGERLVPAGTLVNAGIELWLEQAYVNQLHDNRGLWRYAADLLRDRQPSSSPSHVESLRNRITLGGLVPPNWPPSKAFPYKGMLLSAIYFQEAEKALSEVKAERAWHLTQGVLSRRC